MRTLNLQVAAILFVIVIVFGCGVYFLHAYQVQRNAYVFKRASEAFEERAEEALKKDNAPAARRAYLEAAKNLNWYVRLAPHDVDALEKLGVLTADMAVDQRSRTQAFVMLERVLREDPERTKARRRLVPVAIAIGRFPDARVHLQNYLLKDSPQDAELWNLLAQCYAGEREFGLAVQNFKKAIELAPTQIDAYARLVFVLRESQSAQPRRPGSGWKSWCNGIRKTP